MTFRPFAMSTDRRALPGTDIRDLPAGKCAECRRPRGCRRRRKAPSSAWAARRLGQLGRDVEGDDRQVWRHPHRHRHVAAPRSSPSSRPRSPTPSPTSAKSASNSGPIAIKKGLSQPYKTTNWDKIPAWARDTDGQWAIGYTGTIAFLISKKVKNPPKTFADLLNGDYKVLDRRGRQGRAVQRVGACRGDRRRRRRGQPAARDGPVRQARRAEAAPADQRQSGQHGEGRDRRSASSGISTRSPIATSPARTIGTSSSRPTAR